MYFGGQILKIKWWGREVNTKPDHKLFPVICFITHCSDLHIVFTKYLTKKFSK